jgi:ATP adenylyltransferase/5',5'''-P-1,P-4-tetraphosphate phosphorylase II
MENVTQLDWSDDKCKNGDDVPKILLNKSEYIDRIVPPCNPENTCEVIQDFLGEEVDEWEIIKNQYDLAFKDKKRLLIIREFAEQQLKDIDSDLTAVNINISILDDRYRKYKDNALTNKDFK